MTKRFSIALIVLAASAGVARAASPAPLTTLREIDILDSGRAMAGVPVDLDATVTYFRPYEQTMFVQDGADAIFIQATTEDKVMPGDRIHVRGTTLSGLRPYVVSSDITVLHHGSLPPALPASYDELISAQKDCMRVTIRGVVRAADYEWKADVRGALRPKQPSIRVQVLADGGMVEALVDEGDEGALEGLLDAKVEVTGVAGGKLDGKMEQTGIVIHVPSFSDVRVVESGGASPWSLPITPMHQVMSAYHVNNLSRRVRIHGTVTFYQPGVAAVLQDGSKSLWVSTLGRGRLPVGNVTDGTGFPDASTGFLTLTHGEFRDLRIQAPITPEPVKWSQLVASGKVFDLVSIEGQVVTQGRETGQDEYLVSSDGHLFTAIFRHGIYDPVNGPMPAMKRVAAGSTIRVTGICILEDSNPFNNQVPFSILLRSYDDIALVAHPSPLNVRNLIIVVSVLLLVVLGVGARGWMLERKVRRQTTAMATRIESEAVLERKRSRILEDINAGRPLAEILEQIAALVSFHLNGAACWCQVTNGALLGDCPDGIEKHRVIRAEISSRSGPAHGEILVALDSDEACHGAVEALSVGTRMATLAIETRGLYSDLLHRSEFDLLTDIHNRFSLEKHLDTLIARSRDEAGQFGLIYIDLNEFKEVNDRYGHGVGDLYLQQAAERMQGQLRPGDLLARLGGDEFAVLVPSVLRREDVEDIARRLKCSFDNPFILDGFRLVGSASMGIALYPEDGSTRDALLSSADAAMYAVKHARQAELKAALPLNVV